MKNGKTISNLTEELIGLIEKYGIDKVEDALLVANQLIEKERNDRERKREESTMLFEHIMEAQRVIRGND